jgi:hypothetical protein
VRAALVSVPGRRARRRKISGRAARPRSLCRRSERSRSTRGDSDGARHPVRLRAGDRLRIGYGKLTIYLGSVAGSGKTYAMLDRAHQLIEEGVDVVAALVETHGRADTPRSCERASR